MLSPFPGRRDLFVLAAGLLLGVALGPPVLGSVSPTGYRALFGGTAIHAAAEKAKGEAEVALGQARTQLGLAGAETEGPQGPAREQATANLQRIEQVVAQRVAAGDQAVEAAMDTRAVRWLLGLLVALAGVFAAEAVAAPDVRARNPRPGEEDEAVEVPPALRRLVTVRYALMAATLAVLLARATLYETVPWPFALLLLAVALGAAWVPLGKRSTADAAGASPTSRAATPPVEPRADRADADAG